MNVNKKYLELRIRVIIIMKLNEPIKQHIIFGLHYVICKKKAKRVLRNSHEKIVFMLS